MWEASVFKLIQKNHSIEPIYRPLTTLYRIFKKNVAVFYKCILRVILR